MKRLYEIYNHFKIQDKNLGIKVDHIVLLKPKYWTVNTKHLEKLLNNWFVNYSEILQVLVAWEPGDQTGNRTGKQSE